MRIKDFSNKSGFSIATLRYYDKIKLLSPNRINNVRIYNDSDLETAIGISLLKNLNFSLEEIKKTLEMDKAISTDLPLNLETKRKVQDFTEILKGKINDIDNQFKFLINSKKTLNKVLLKATKFLNNKAML